MGGAARAVTQPDLGRRGGACGLGFSIAAHLEPDILLLDEVLAVGDAEFQAKCLERVNELHRHGRTIVFISHDLTAVERLCRRVVLLSHGQVMADGPARDVIALYQERARKQRERLNLPLFPTTTIGSFPQTSEIRKTRRAFRRG